MNERASQTAPRATIPLHRLDLSELRLGSELPGHLRDKDGNVIVEAGQRLNEARLRLLAKHTNLEVYVGSDWPRAGTARADDSAVVEELREFLKREATSRDDAGKMRKSPRQPWSIQLTVVLMIEQGASTVGQTFDVQTRDISGGGFSFTAHRYIHAGTLVYTRLDPLPNRPVIKGVVRNCQYIEGRDHRIGVEFIELDARSDVPDELLG